LAPCTGAAVAAERKDDVLSMVLMVALLIDCNTEKVRRWIVEQAGECFGKELQRSSHRASLKLFIINGWSYSTCVFSYIYTKPASNSHRHTAVPVTTNPPTHPLPSCPATPPLLQRRIISPAPALSPRHVRHTRRHILLNRATPHRHLPSIPQQTTTSNISHPHSRCPQRRPKPSSTTTTTTIPPDNRHLPPQSPDDLLVPRNPIHEVQAAHARGAVLCCRVATEAPLSVRFFFCCCSVLSTKSMIG
jgi:hypothetical protein